MFGHKIKNILKLFKFSLITGLPLRYVTEIVQPKGPNVQGGNLTRACLQVVEFYQGQNLWSLVHPKTKGLGNINPWSHSSQNRAIIEIMSQLSTRARLLHIRPSCDEGCLQRPRSALHLNTFLIRLNQKLLK